MDILTNDGNQSAKLDSPSPTQTIGRLARQQSAKERPASKYGNDRAGNARIGLVEVAVELVIAVRDDGSDDTTIYACQPTQDSGPPPLAHSLPTRQNPSQARKFSQIGIFTATNHPKRLFYVTFLCFSILEEWRLSGGDPSANSPSSLHASALAEKLTVSKEERANRSEDRGHIIDLSAGSAKSSSHTENAELTGAGLVCARTARCASESIYLLILSHSQNSK